MIPGTFVLVTSVLSVSGVITVRNRSLKKYDKRKVSIFLIT